ncbi:hypothetical protein SprV_0401718700 [Sparganum proliferum]|nr:unnamed protein product [Spirometra erinaceieuropaei]
MFAVEHRVDHKVVYKRLLNLVLKRMRENEIKQVVILPLNEDKRRRMLQVIGDGGPLRFINSDREFQFYI